jgi:hypothetical protein
MHAETGKFHRLLLIVTLIVVALIGVAQSALAGDEEKPAVNGKNSKIQLSGVGWVVYRYLLADETNASAPKGFLSKDGADRQDANSFDLDRVQVTGDYMFNDRITWRTILEGDNLGGAFRLYVKNGYLRVKDPWGLPNTSFKFGLYAHGMTGTIDDLWGYRLVSENSINRYLGVSSAYTGVGMDTKLAKGVVDLDLGIANELGYGVAGADGKANRSKYKTFMGRVILTPPGEDPLLKSFHLALWGQRNGKNPVSQADANYVAADLLPKNASDNRNLWFEVFPYFKKDKLAAGFEYGLAWNGSTRQLKAAKASTGGAGTTAAVIERMDVRSRYVGGVITYQILPKLGCFGRLDLYDPDIDSDASWAGTVRAPKELRNLMTTTVIAGISHSYATGVRSIIDVEYSTFEKPKNTTSGAELSLDPDITISARMELKL